MSTALRSRLGAALAGLLVVLGLARIAATYTVFSQTVDEPAHLAAGMEWLDLGRFTYEAKHPPLPRVLIALGPYLDGLRSHGERKIVVEGNRILEDRGTYLRNLTLARLGVLPFFLIGALAVWGWTRRLYGEAAAVAATALFTFLPPILAHSGLATTDMALAAMLPVALLMLTLWLERPTPGRSALLGAAFGLAVLSKISAVVLVPVCAVAIIACKWFVERREQGGRGGRRTLLPGGARSLAIVAVVAVVVLWAGYRFALTSHPKFFGGRVSLPLLEVLLGFYQLQEHNEQGHPAFLLGQLSQKGWWYFFPVTLAVKTPLPFLVLSVAGLMMLVRSLRARPDWRPLVPLVGAAAVLALSMTSNINNGVRHVLAVYSFLAIVAGYGAVAAWNAATSRVPARAAVAGLALWLGISTVRVRPDYLSYFNELALGRPERIVVNTDLCWGQDYFRLVDALRARGIDSAWVAYHGSLDVARHSLPGMRTLPPRERVTGWVAASARELKGVRHQGWEWIDGYTPVARVGQSIWLYYVPPDGERLAAPSSQAASK